VIGIIVALFAKQVPTIVGSFFGQSLHACEANSSGVVEYHLSSE
jgi:hypothetical protein